MVSPEDQNGTELLLEPNNHPAAKEYQEKIFADGIPATMFAVEDVREVSKRLMDKGVKCTMEPAEMGEITIADCEDTCYNVIQVVQQ